MRKRWRNIGIVAGGLLAVCATAATGWDWYETRVAESSYRTGNSAQRRSALRDLARLRSQRADAVVQEALVSPSPDTRFSAAYAVGSARRTDLAADLEVAWRREADSPTLSGMIYYWAQVAGPAAEAALRPMLTSQDPWVVLGASKGLLRLGNLRAADVVLSMAGQAGGALAIDARKELQSLAVPMSGMVGQHLEVAEVSPTKWTDEQTARLVAWWRVHVTRRLLADYLAWRNDKPEAWRKASHLQHQWNGHVSKILRMSEAGQNMP